MRKEFKKRIAELEAEIADGYDSISIFQDGIDEREQELEILKSGAYRLPFKKRNYKWADLRKWVGKKKIGWIIMNKWQFNRYHWLMTGQNYDPKTYYNFSYNGIPIRPTFQNETR